MLLTKFNQQCLYWINILIPLMNFLQGMTVDNSATVVDTHLANSGFNLFGQPLSPSGSHPASPVSEVG